MQSVAWLRCPLGCLYERAAFAAAADCAVSSVESSRVGSVRLRSCVRVFLAVAGVGRLLAGRAGKRAGYESVAVRCSGAGRSLTDQIAALMQSLATGRSRQVTQLDRRLAAAVAVAQFSQQQQQPDRNTTRDWTRRLRMARRKRKAAELNG